MAESFKMIFFNKTGKRARKATNYIKKLKFRLDNTTIEKEKTTIHYQAQLDNHMTHHSKHQATTPTLSYLKLHNSNIIVCRRLTVASCVWVA